MGYEYRLHVEPPVRDLAAVCSEVFSISAWQERPTSLTDIPTAIGVQRNDTPPNTSWPHVADVYIEETGSVFVLCHSQDGGLFLNALVESLRGNNHTVTVNDDI